MVKIDLKQDAADVQTLLINAVRSYASEEKTIPVSRIDLAFSLGDGESTPWVHVHFDTKPGSEPDGNPTHPDFAQFNRESWMPVVQAVCEDKRVAVLLPNGKTVKCGAEELTATIGTFLVDALIAARDEGVFTSLPKCDRCELGVEDPTSGEFGWPAYDDRGKVNLVK